MNWVDRLLLLIEILILLKMLKMDTSNSQAIQRFLGERERWYARRAHLKTIQQVTTEPQNEKAPDELGPSLAPNETVELLKESENEQNEQP